jgi:DNA polymerase III delta prime subunit
VLTISRKQKVDYMIRKFTDEANGDKSKAAALAREYMVKKQKEGDPDRAIVAGSALKALQKR